MVNTLDGNNPTQLLISAIKKEGLDTHVSGSFKEEEQFSIAALREDGKVRNLDFICFIRCSSDKPHL
jgi:hypothetical protein